MKLLSAVLTIFFALPPLAIGGENCGMMGGQCRDSCDQGEEILEGAFIDCGEKQECCIPKAPQKKQGKDSETGGQGKTQDK